MEDDEPVMQNRRNIRPAAHTTREARRTLSIRVEFHRLGDDPAKCHQKVVELSKLADVIVQVSKFRTRIDSEDNHRENKGAELLNEMNENGRKMYERVRISKSSNINFRRQNKNRFRRKFF